MIKNLKRLFGSIFVLLFIFISIANTVIFASSLGYFSDSEIYYGDYSRDNLHDLKLRQNRFIRPYVKSINWDTLCTKIAELSGEEIPCDIEDQQLMVCRNLYLLFTEEPKRKANYELQDVLFLLCENDQSFYLCLGDKNLDCELNCILKEEFDQLSFYGFYEKSMITLKIRPTAEENMRRADALLLLSYMYLLCGTDKLQKEEWIFNVGEEADLIILLNKIFSNTIYEPILEAFPPVHPLYF